MRSMSLRRTSIEVSFGVRLRICCTLVSRVSSFANFQLLSY
jgi:hypothetical protein